MRYVIKTVLVGLFFLSCLTINAQDTEPPSDVTGLVASNITYTTFDISWEPATDNVAVLGYNIFLDFDYIDVTAGTSFSFTGLLPGTTYTVRLYATDTVGNDSVNITTLDVTTPALALISSNGLVCSGGDAIFTITGEAGSVVTYSGASTGTATIGAGGTVDVVISGVTANTTLNLTNVYYGATNYALTETETVIVSGTINPPTLSTNSPICSGDDAIFTIIGDPGDVVTYSGASTGTAVIGASSTVAIVISGVTADTTLTLTNISNGTCSNVLGITETLIVSGAISIPTLSSNSPVSSGEDAIFTITGTSGDVVTYSGASGGMATIGAGGTVDVVISSVTADTTLTLTDVSNGTCSSVLGITETVTVDGSSLVTLASNSPVCSGGDAIFTITGDPGDVVTYSGASSGTATIGAGGTVDVVISGVTADTTLDLTNVFNGVTNSVLTLTETVTIDVSPSGVTLASNSPVSSGEDAIFTITGTPGDVVTYSGASSGTVTIGAGGTVEVVISGVTADTTLNLTDVFNGSCNSGLSLTETVTVGAPPSVVTLASNSPICSGGDAIFTITGDAGDVVTYSGASSGTATIGAGGTVEVVISGVTADTTLNLTNVFNGVTNSVLTLTETVIVGGTITLPALSTNSPICSGGDAIFTITGDAGDVVTYSGALSGTATIAASGIVDVVISGVTADTPLTLTDVSSGACSSVLGITETVLLGGAITPTLSSNSPVSSGGDAIFTITGTPGDVVTYSGASSGTAMIGAGGSVDVVVSGVTADTTLTLTDVSSGACSNVLSGITETVTVTSPTDTEPPTDVTGLVVSNLMPTSFDISWNPSTDNVQVLGYDVFLDLAPEATIAETSYSFTGLLPGTTYTVHVWAIDTSGNISTTLATIDVTTPALTTMLSSNSPVCSGGDAIFTITGDAGDVVTYSGSSSGTTTIGAGGTVDVVISGITADTTLNLTNVFNGVTNSVLTLTETVIVSAPPSGVTLSSNSPVSSGEDAIFTILGTPGDVVTYSGALSGMATIGAGGTVDVVISGVTADTTLTLTDVSNGTCSSVLGITETVTVGGSPSGVTLASNSPVCTGDDAIFTITGDAGDVVTYSGASSGTVTIGAGGTVDVVISGVTADTTLDLTNVFNGVTNTGLTLTETVTVGGSPSGVTLASNSPVCLGEDAIFTITGDAGDVVTYSGALSGTATIAASGTVDVVISGVTADTTLSLTEVSRGACTSVLSISETVTVNPFIPTTVTTNSPICSGEDAIWTITGTPGSVITYSGLPAGTVTIGPGGTAEVIIPLATTDLTLAFLLPSGCAGGGIVTETITVVPYPIAPTLSSNSPVSSGEDAIFTITGDAGNVVTYSGASSGTAMIGAGGSVDIVIIGVTADTTLTLTDVSSGVCTSPLPGITETVIVDASSTDTQAPTEVTGLEVSNVMSTSFDISWLPSTDNVGVIGYNVYLDGVLDGYLASRSLASRSLDSRPPTSFSYSFSGLAPNTTYTVSVRAVDAAGNESKSLTFKILLFQRGCCSGP